jgi:hypothetical protein
MLVASLEDFREAFKDEKVGVAVQRVKEITLESKTTFNFPFKDAHEQARNKLIVAEFPPLMDGAVEEPEQGANGRETPWDDANVLDPPAVARELDVRQVGPVDDKAQRITALLPEGVRRVKGGFMYHDVMIRDRANSLRPPWILPQNWGSLSRKSREQLEAEWESIKAPITTIDPGYWTSVPSALVCQNERETSCSNPWTDVPAMPTVPCSHEHRPHVVEHELPFSALVARPVSKAEVKTNPKAQEALQKEWDRLRMAGCWDESKVVEWGSVSKAARESGTKLHVGRIFAICVEKGSELPEGNPNRKFKGRVVFQGNQVYDENWDAALFQELGSSPASLEAGKICDAYGMAPGHASAQSDAVQAYVQTKLGGDVPTYVRLPEGQWPRSL